jgi:hypothetical protein
LGAKRATVARKLGKDWRRWPRTSLVAGKSPAARPTPGEVAARVEGVAVPPDLARETFAVTRALARPARTHEAG